MPEFRSPFSGLANDRKLTDAELVRAIRFMVAAEYEAIQLYTQLAESTDNKLAVEVLKDIANEERVHAGESLRLLRELAPDEQKFYAEGAEQVEEAIEKLEYKDKAAFEARQGKQIVVTFKNRIGLLFDIFKLLADKRTSILAVCCNIRGEDGVLWLVTDDNLRATDVLNESGYVTEAEEVILVELPHKPEMLKRITEVLALEDFDIWHLYATVPSGQEKCLVVLRTGNDEHALLRLNGA